MPDLVWLELARGRLWQPREKQGLSWRRLGGLLEEELLETGLEQ